MSDPQYRAIQQHLAHYLYRCELRDEKIVAYHPSKPNLLFTPLLSGWIGMASYRLRPEAEERRRDLLAFVNRLNRAAWLIQFTVDEENDLLLAAYYPGPYEQPAFARFMEIWHDDVAMLLHAPETAEYLQ